ncbi:hypothetical protein KY341_05825 [Candidatus Woesearchaeota archaeon]|nr:hypothetical protein [Candidatus Woesearchaeota archaeon]
MYTLNIVINIIKPDTSAIRVDKRPRILFQKQSQEAIGVENSATKKLVINATREVNNNITISL